MNQENLICLAVGIIILFGCGPIDDNGPGPFPDDEMPIDTLDCPNFESMNFKVVWQSRIHPELKETRSIIPQLFADKIVFSDRVADNNENLVAFDLSDGNVIWRSLDSSPSIQSIASTSGNISNDLDLVFGVGKSVVNLSGLDGKENWRYDFNYGGPRGTLLNSQFYFTERFKSGNSTVRAELKRTRIDIPSWQIVYSENINNGFEPSFENPSLYINTISDSILIFQNRQFDFTNGGGGKIDLLAFSLSTDQIIWKQEDISDDGNSSIFTPLIHDSKVFFQASQTVHCFDAETGNEIWSQTITDGGLNACPNLITDDKIIVNSNLHKLTALDLITGDIIWQNTSAGSNVVNMDTYNGVLYYGSKGTGKIFAHDLSTGDKLYESYPPNRECDSSSGFASGVVIDQNTGFLYIHDNFYALCIDLNN